MLSRRSSLSLLSESGLLLEGTTLGSEVAEKAGEELGGGGQGELGEREGELGEGGEIDDRECSASKSRPELTTV